MIRFTERVRVFVFFLLPFPIRRNERSKTVQPVALFSYIHISPLLSLSLARDTLDSRRSERINFFLRFYFILPSSIRFFEIDRLDRLRKYFENTINWSEIFGKTEYLDIQNVIISFLFQFKFQITLGYKLLLLLWLLWQASSRYLISLFK